MPGRDLARRVPASVWWTAAAWVPMLGWFAAFRPGLMSADSLASWRQATGATWSDLQPPVYTGAMWVSNAITGSPSLLTLAQSLLLASSFVAIGTAVIRAGAKRRLVVVTLGILVASPMVGAFSVSLWKDIPFAAVALFVGARLVDLAVAREAGADEAAARALTRVVAWSVFTVVLRQNGILVAGALLVVLVVVLVGQRKAALLGLVACGSALVATKVVLFPLLGVQPGPPNSEVSTMLHDIASVAARDPGALDADDQALLESVAPLAAWTEGFRGFSCRSANWQFDRAFAGWRAIDGEQGRFVSLWLELSRENPRAVVGNRLCVGAVAWRPDEAGLLYTVSRGIDANDLGLRTVPLIESLNEPAQDVLDALDEPPVQQVAWRAPGWIYLAYVVAAVLARRRSRWLLLPFAPLAATQIAVAGLNPAQDARYMLPAMFLAVALLPMATAIHPRPSTPPDVGATEPGDATPRPPAVGAPTATPAPEETS